MRPLAPALLAACALALPACGGSDADSSAQPVRLTMTGPADGSVVRAGEVELTGRVIPAGAAVTVRGEGVAVHGGRFSARVPLDAGGNVIDVMATARELAPAMTAVRVERRLTIRVPDVVGDSPNDAQARLAAAGLVVRTDDVGGVLDDLLPASRGVCETDPGAGSTVDRGSTVKVSVAKVC
jgi:hypothetical protein